MEIEHNYEPHPKQREFHKCDKRFIVANSGRRFGKSIMAANELLKRALAKKGRYWVVAPTYRQVKAIYWGGLISEYYPRQVISKKNESDLSIHLKNGSIIEFKGADNPDSLRGVKLNGVIMDEYAFTKPFVWEEIIQPMIRETEGWGVFISTPRGFNHFYDMCEFAKKDPEWEYFHFTAYDNPYFSAREIEKAKENTSKEKFAQEYMADFTKNAGLVFSEFDLGLHTIELSQPKPDWVKYRSIDFGYTNPTAVLWIGVDKDDNIFVYDELYRNGLYTSELAHLIHAKSADYYTMTYGDSAAAQSIKDISEHGIYVQPISKTTGSSKEDYVQAGIEKVKQYLKTNANGQPKLFIAKHCQNLIDEFLSYEWEVLKQEQEGERNNPEKPRKVNDHALDALRMFIYEHTRPMKTQQQSYQSVNEWTGY